MSKTVTAAPLRREELLAFLVEQLARGRGCPTYAEMGQAMGVAETRARQLVDQLVSIGIVEKTPGRQRNLIIRDVTLAREIVVQVFRKIGGLAAAPLGELMGHCAQAQLPIVAVLEHTPGTAGEPHAHAPAY